LPRPKLSCSMIFPAVRDAHNRGNRRSMALKSGRCMVLRSPTLERCTNRRKVAILNKSRGEVIRQHSNFPNHVLGPTEQAASCVVLFVRHPLNSRVPSTRRMTATVVKPNTTAITQNLTSLATETAEEDITKLC
jgi:hypothetical protein